MANARLSPDGSPVWSDFDLTLLDHSETDQTAGLNNFGDDQIAGGSEDDMIFGQLGDDIIQGDGNISVNEDVASLIALPDADAYRDAYSELQVVPSFEAESDGDDYIEGNGGNDVIFGNLGQDDVLGGSSDLFGLSDPSDPDADRDLRPDGSDLIFGGAGLESTTDPQQRRGS